jgi:hypothetical protein
MAGVELTTHYGHALALGGQKWREWRANSLPGVSMPGIARETRAAGEVFVIAHPRSPGDPSCTGCRWEYDDVMPGPARAVEIWNGPWSDYNEEGLALFYNWLCDGHRLVATAGTDIHGPHERDDAHGFNNVKAEDRSERAILAAVAAGHAFLSSGPRLVATLHDPARDQARPMGSSAPTSEGQAIVELGPGTTGELRLVADGKLVQRQATQAGVLRLDVPRGAGWFTLELRAPTGELTAITNPIYLDDR